jgi:acetyltransferase-like isoleucine patch superfamily enzyme
MTGEESAQQSRATGLLARIKRSWARDQELSLARRIEKGLRFATRLLRARAALKDCDRVGASARVAGRMRVSNRGSIVIGDYLNINSCWVPTELLTRPGGRIEIGDEVLINFGTVIAPGRSVAIGKRSTIGPHRIISDVEIPQTANITDSAAARPIEIGRDVWLAGRVTLRPGVKIGDGAVIVAGSIVESDVPAHVMASGIPARLLPKLGGVIQDFFNASLKLFLFDRCLSRFTVPAYSVRSSVTSCRIKFPA